MWTRANLWGVAVSCLLPACGTTARASDPWNMTKVQMVSRTQGWALAETPRGRVLLRTTDGGRDWGNVSPKSIWPLSPMQIKANEDYGIGAEGIDCYFLNGQTGWVAMEARRQVVVPERTSHGGQIWKEKDLEDPMIVERTQDGGRHWRRSHLIDHVAVDLQVSFLDQRHGFILAVSDMASGSTRKDLYRTGDGGRTWGAVTEDLPNYIDTIRVTFRTPLEGWLTAGYHGGDEVPFYRTEDAGRHWHLQEIDTSPLYDNGYAITYPPLFFGASRLTGILPVGFVAHSPERAGLALYQTPDAGRTWRFLRRFPIGNPLQNREADVEFIDARTAWTLSEAGQPTASLLLTQDGGRHWHVVYPLRRKSH